jgi:RNA polymerase sigma-70 factor (ECF subfamily)
MDLIQLCQAGDEEAFALLFEKYKNLAYQTAYLMLGSAEEADDALQEVFVRVYRSLATFHPAKGAFSTWLHRITVNYCLNQRRRRQLATLPLEDAPLASLAAWPSMSGGQVEVEDALHRALIRLTEKQRVVVILRYYWDMSYAEMAQVLDVPLGTIRSRLNSAMKALRKEMAKVTDDVLVSSTCHL